MTRSVTIYALRPEQGCVPEFYPSLKLARQAFDWMIEGGDEPEIQQMNVPMNREGLCDALNELADFSA